MESRIVDGEHDDNWCKNATSRSFTAVCIYVGPIKILSGNINLRIVSTFHLDLHQFCSETLTCIYFLNPLIKPEVHSAIMEWFSAPKPELQQLTSNFYISVAIPEQHKLSIEYWVDIVEIYILEVQGPFLWLLWISKLIFYTQWVFLLFIQAKLMDSSDYLHTFWP